MSINYVSLVNNMKNTINYVNIIKNEQNLLKKCILCKSYLSSNQWSILLENTVKEKFNILKKINNTSGDGISVNNKTIEIKISLGSTNGQFSFVQLRPGHSLDYYLFLIYNINDNNTELGKISWFLCKPHELYELLPQYGNYAHGTLLNNGKITIDSIYKNTHLEYSLRPNPMKNGKPKELWDIMISTFSKTEQEINLILNEKNT